MHKDVYENITKYGICRTVSSSGSSSATSITSTICTSTTCTTCTTTCTTNQPVPAQPIQCMPQLNWLHFKPEFAGKPDEDAETHLLKINDFKDTHAFQEGVKVQYFCLALIGEVRL